MFKKSITKEDYEKLEIKYEILLDEYNALLNEVNNLKATKKLLQENNEVNIEQNISIQDDVLLDEVIEYAKRNGTISASLIQRKFSIGYNRAARMMDNLEEKGIIGPSNGAKPREVIIK